MATTTTDPALARTPSVGERAPELVLATGKGPSTGKAVVFRLSEALRKGPKPRGKSKGSHGAMCKTPPIDPVAIRAVRCT